MLLQTASDDDDYPQCTRTDCDGYYTRKLFVLTNDLALSSEELSNEHKKDRTSLIRSPSYIRTQDEGNE